MLKINNDVPDQYLSQKNISFIRKGNELITACLFNNCDADSKDNEAHLYISAETGQFHCKKCGETGNLTTLDIYLSNEKHQHGNEEQKSIEIKTQKFDYHSVDKCHKALPQNIRQYLNDRGLANHIIDEYKLGWGCFYEKWWITIPIKDILGTYAFFKLRQDPNKGDEKMTYPKGVHAQIYDWDTIHNTSDKIFICEGELDKLLLLSKGVSAITSTHGATTFNKDWSKELVKIQNIYVCFDNDKAGLKGAEKVAKMVKNDKNNTYIITLPETVGEHGDITDYFVKLKGNVHDLFNVYAKEYPEKIDTSKFKPITCQNVADILKLTIKQDDVNKIVTFLCELSAYTEDSQFNISSNAPSSTGKSFIPMEIAALFPHEDVIELAYCSPTAFFHDNGEWDADTKSYTVNLSRKILIFLDQPHNELLTRLRPLLSHDRKEIILKITDKTQKFGLKTKTIILKGYPSVIFSTAGLKIDEQEATRFLLLSPEINQEKIKQGILETLKRESDSKKYYSQLEENQERKLFQLRIKAIKIENITEIKISNCEIIERRFLEHYKILKPRHQRDIKRLISIIKSIALLNIWFREKVGSTIIANDTDIEEAFQIWWKISKSQELNLPPYVYNIFQEVILSAFNDKNDNNSFIIGLSRQDILQKHLEIYGRMLDTSQLRQQILPMLETAGLIVQEADKDDRRKLLIYPLSEHK